MPDKTATFIPYQALDFAQAEMQERSRSYYQLMDQRRSLRHFADKDVPRELIETLIKTASTAPSGAHKQPWTFCAVRNPEIKAAIREAAEKEEYEEAEKLNLKI